MAAYTEYRKALEIKKAFEAEAKNRAEAIINAGGTDLPPNVKITSPENDKGFHVAFSMEIRSDFGGDVRIFVEPWDLRETSYKVFIPVTDLFAKEA